MTQCFQICFQICVPHTEQSTFHTSPLPLLAVCALCHSHSQVVWCVCGCMHEWAAVVCVSE